ncbi:hypothetical protein MMC17_005242 [Xylographa soralifera]|nr:hypothetical protein [Xylographa soralifera]
MPVWTAFINDHVQALEWIQRAAPRKVYLLELNRFVFTDDYKPQMALTGEDELYFIEPHSADQFMEAMENLRY